MIENYKGWDITLNWDVKDNLKRDITKSYFFNQKEKWIGVHLNGKKIYGSSLKEIRHIIDYPSLYESRIKDF
jgi:phage anti-repressor protein